MNLGGGVFRGRKIWLGLGAVVLTLCLLAPAPRPAQAGQGETTLAIGASIIGVIGTAAIAYGIYENLPSRQGKERLIPGEFYVGIYGGAALTPSQDLKYSQGLAFTNGITTFGQGNVTVRKNKFDPGIVGGLKFGYFFTKWCPYLGLEVETNVNRSPIRQQTASLSRPLLGTNVASLPSDNWINWTLALHIIGRYGFFPDKEVPFGRLQPYVGIGPGLVMMYDEVDSAKNFAVDVMAGVRYMALKNVSLFVEYKYSHQWDAEMEAHYFNLPGIPASVERGTAHLDYDSHKIVVGVAYHF